MILIDTNVLLRAAQPAHADCAAAKHAVKSARLGGYMPCLVPQVIYEYWVVATRPMQDNGLGMTTPEAAADIAQLTQQFRFLRDERSIFDRWEQIVVQYAVQGKTGHDARLVAAMDRHGIGKLLTFNDSHFRRFSRVHVIHPNRISDLEPWNGT